MIPAASAAAAISSVFFIVVVCSVVLFSVCGVTLAEVPATVNRFFIFFLNNFWPRITACQPPVLSPPHQGFPPDRAWVVRQVFGAMVKEVMLTLGVCLSIKGFGGLTGGERRGDWQSEWAVASGFPADSGIGFLPLPDLAGRAPRIRPADTFSPMGEKVGMRGLGKMSHDSFSRGLTGKSAVFIQGAGIRPFGRGIWPEGETVWADGEVTGPAAA